uniref:Uncharacterized protein n=1 Tax=Serinus canaria TaxID=9135 RepID=A0A8C9KSN3_SERCA
MEKKYSSRAQNHPDKVLKTLDTTTICIQLTLQCEPLSENTDINLQGVYKRVPKKPWKNDSALQYPYLFTALNQQLRSTSPGNLGIFCSFQSGLHR